MDICTTLSNRSRTRRRRGSIYIFVLTTSMIVLTVGLSALAIARIRTRQSMERDDQSEARSLASTAIEHAMSMLDFIDIKNDLDNINGIGIAPFGFGDGTFHWRIIKEHGGEPMGDNENVPIRLYGTGLAGDATWTYRVLLSTDTPLEVLYKALHANDLVFVMAGNSVTVIGAPLSTNGDVSNDGMIDGDVEAASISKTGAITGDLAVPDHIKELPGNNAYSQYVSKATALAYNGDLDTIVLTPTVNEYGSGLNVNGIYYIHTNGADIEIRDSRIHGTLVIDAGNGTVRITNAVLMNSYRDNYPVLIVRGDLELDCDGDDELDEGVEGHNFNPVGAPYNSQADADQSDTYLSEIRGLVHVLGDLKFTKPQVIRGVVICEGSVSVGGDPKIIHDPSIAANPPEGYTDPDGDLIIVPGSWQRKPTP